jgi:hypothetical protein
MQEDGLPLKAYNWPSSGATMTPGIRHRWIVKILVLSSALLAGAARSADFSYSLDQPTLAVTIPGTPAMEMGPHPHGGPSRPFLRAYGISGDVVVSIMTPDTEGAMKVVQCADQFALRLQDSIVQATRITRISLDETTILVYYIGMADMRLHAHLYSAAPGYCVDVHVSRGPAPRAELIDWLRGLHAARVRVGAPAAPDAAI